MVNVVLFEPEIPPNTGNIARLVVGVNGNLFIAGKPSFSMDEKSVRRAGLDYWKHLNLHLYENLDQLITEHPDKRMLYFTKHGKTSLWDFNFQESDFLIFGPETRGLPLSMIEKNKENTIFLPMYGPVRSINLSNSVAVAVYEYLRQLHQKPE